MHEWDTSESRIEWVLKLVEERLAILTDGIDHWDEILPPMEKPLRKAKPRRWPLDDHKARTVGEALRSRYSDAWPEVMRWQDTLRRAYEHKHMAHDQQTRYEKTLNEITYLRPKVAERGLD